MILACAGCGDNYACNIDAQGFCIFTGSPHQTGLEPGTENIVDRSGTVLFGLHEALAANAESGVPSLADLRAAYPDAARRALSAARANDAGGRSIGDFLRDNLGARSLEPRDGDDADAVLSRAEGALTAGRLGDALAELETLPDASRAELSGWIEQAETRRNAIAAAEELNASLSDS